MDRLEQLQKSWSKSLESTINVGRRSSDIAIEGYTVQEVHPTSWDGVERRNEPSPDMIFLQLMVETRKIMEDHENRESDKFRLVREEMAEDRRQSEERHRQLMDRHDAMSESTMNLLNTNNATVKEIHSMFKKAFPEGDVEAHRRAHEHWMEKERQDREFWIKTKQSVVQWVIIASLAWGGLVLWAAFLKGPNA